MNNTEIDFKKAKSIYEFEVSDNNGNLVQMEQYKGKVCLIVNISAKDPSSEKMFKQLTSICRKYKNGKNVAILAFPCFQFTTSETFDGISDFIKENNFEIGDLFYPIEVNGPQASNLYKFLKYKIPGKCGGFINSNFTMFVVDKDGMPVERTPSNIHPYLLEDLIETSMGRKN